MVTLKQRPNRRKHSQNILPLASWYRFSNACLASLSFGTAEARCLPSHPEMSQWFVFFSLPARRCRRPRGESCSRVWWLLRPVLQHLVQLTDKISPNLAFSWRTVFPACFILYITSHYTMFSVCYYGYYAQKQFFLICMCLPEHPFLKNRENQCCPFLYCASTLHILLEAPN